MEHAVRSARGYVPRVLPRLASSTVARRGLNAWSELGASSKRQMDALLRGTSALRNRGCGRLLCHGCFSPLSPLRARIACAMPTQFHASGLSKGWRTIMEAFARRRNMKTAMATMRLRKVRLCVNTWFGNTRGRDDKRRQLGGIVRTFDPQLRKVRHAYNSINALWRQRRRLLKAAQSIVDGRKMRGFNSWSSGIRELHRGMSLRKLAHPAFVIVAFSLPRIRGVLTSLQRAASCRSGAQLC